MALFVVLVLATALLPETMPRVPGALSAMRPDVAIPKPARRAFAAAVPTMVSTWALGGLILSVGGSLLGTTFRQTTVGVIGLMIALFPVSGGAASLVARNLSSPIVARLGSALLSIGTGLFLLALGWSSLPLFAVAAVVAGAGFGTGFLGALRSISQLAEPHERAALLSAVFIVTYLAFSVPAVVAGVLAIHIGLRPTAFGYGGFVAVLAVGTLGFERVSVRRERHAV